MAAAARKTPWFVLVLALAVPPSAPALAQRPIIAVFAQNDAKNASAVETLAASYVKWVEQAGARVIPLRRGDSAARVASVMAQVDGLLFPGGDGGVPDSARLALRLALEANARGVPVPVFGTCLGFEWIVVLAAKERLVLDLVDAENVSLPLELTPDAASSRLLGGHSNAPLRAALSSLPLTMNNHHFAISVESWERHRTLGGMFRVLSSSTDRKGARFVSTVEARSLPIFAVQWHPEKSQFEWGWVPASSASASATSSASSAAASAAAAAASGLSVQAESGSRPGPSASPHAPAHSSRDTPALTPPGRPYEAIDHSGSAVLASQHLANVFVGYAREASRRAAELGRAAPADDGWSELVWQYPVGSERLPGFVQTYRILERRAELATARR